MTTRRFEIIAYLLGLIVLGLFYTQLKAMVSGPIFLMSIICYLIAVRGISFLFARRISKSSVSAGDGDV